MKAAVFFADGFEDIEALSPVDYLRRAKIDVITVGVLTGSQTKQIDGKTIITSSHNVPMIMDMSLKDYLKEYDNNLPDCVICPGGGKGAINLSLTNELLSHLEKAWDNDKYVCAICASPAVVLGKTKILKNKKWTCYPEMQTEAKEEYLNGYSNEVFITDGKLITSRGPGASEQFAMEIVKKLAGEDVYQNIKTSSQQR